MRTSKLFITFLFQSVNLLILLIPGASTAQPTQQLLILPEVRYLSQEPDSPGLENNDFSASLDLLYALDIGQYRFFGEFIASDEDNTLARLQLGYETHAGTTFWLGRFQTAQGYWNKTFHFRNYIQPSIQQPGIAGYEDEGGALNTHFSGLKLRQRWQAGNDSALQLEAGFGASAKFDDRRLDAYDLLDPDGGRKPSSSLRLSYQPNPGTDTEFGVFFVDSRISMKQNQFTQNDQHMIGGFGNTRFDAMRLYGALYFVNNDLKSSSSSQQDDTFYSAWVQSDYRFNANWMPYIRVEHSNAKRSDAYISLFPRFVRNRWLAGLRWDFLDNQAIKLEYADTDFLREDSDQWAAQWSIILP